MAAGAEPLLRTVLHEWHAANNARMVAFGGWSMPVHYPGGVIREHVATRTRTGLFDVCHMGRFRFSGRGAERFLARTLTNDASTLAPEQAHYTLVANERGGAIDDAYLYRIAAEDFLLVVNAANRSRDWEWLHAQAVPHSVQIADHSEAMAMFALQGPRAENVLSAIVDADCIPEPRRNRLRVGRYDGHALFVARTGYTGEAVGFEVFVDVQVAVALWQRLVDGGACAAGLGARDSLRLEAGLPLYGHELGCDRDGREIPIFANRLARFGVRKPGNGDYVGVKALDAQRAEYDAIAAGGVARPRWLPQWIQPIAVFDGRRPLRAGYDLLLGDEPVGYVTSGSSVPIGTESSTGQYGMGPIGVESSMRQHEMRPIGVESSIGQHEMRPIGLALVRSGLRFDPAAPRRLTVRDARQVLMQAHLVARNLPRAPSPPTPLPEGEGS